MGCWKGQRRGSGALREKGCMVCFPRCVHRVGMQEFGAWRSAIGAYNVLERHGRGMGWKLWAQLF